MKKIFLSFAVLAMSMAMFTSCSSDDDDENVKILGFEGNKWSALIDDPQYQGPMLYGDGTYSWTDDATKLSGGLTNAWGDGMFWGGGVAISNYIDADLENHATYNYQLAVPTSNGSATFAVVYCDASVSFADGKARTIKSMDVSPTTYQLGVTKNGDESGTKALTEEGDFLTVFITGYNGEKETGTVTFDLAKDGNILTTWKKIDLSKLGDVTSLSFTMEGSDNSSYGVKQPKYFAFDNVAVKF